MKNIATALAAFERTLVARNAPVDRYDAGDESALDEAAVRGKGLFFGRARCATCHSGPNFTDGLFHNTGVIGERPGAGRLRSGGRVPDAAVSLLSDAAGIQDTGTAQRRA